MKPTNKQQSTESGLPTLYSRRTDRKIQIWQVEVQGNRFRVISGIIDGQKVTSEWTVCQGKNPGKKNATTGEAQAEKEARALWKKKMDEGYRVDIADVDNILFTPMLAHSYDDHYKAVAEALEGGEMVWCQPKLDGMRCIVTAAELVSRNGKQIGSAPHVLEAFQPVFEMFPDFVFDGELYSDKFADDFNRIISLAKKGKPTPEDLAESAEHLQYHVYDNFNPNERDSRFTTRLLHLREQVKKLGKGSPVVLVETVMVNTFDRIEELFGQWRAKGYEGAMIRLDRPYEPGRRSRSLLKFKQFQEEEFTVVDVLEGIGNKSGMAGALEFATASGRRFTAAVMGNRDFFRRLLSDRKNVIGKPATVQFQNYTPDGSPRFPCVKAIRDYE